MIDNNAALTALWHPFQSGALDWKEPCLFLRARAGMLPQEMHKAELDCQQSFKPFADQLKQAGYQLAGPVKKTYPLVLVLPPPQRDETRALFARALQSADEDGIVVASMQNNAGAKSGEADLRQLVPNVQSLSKHKCRIFWAKKRDIDETVLNDWLNFDEPRLLEATGFFSRPGIFAWNRIDVASKLLGVLLPGDLSGRGADLGAGLGYLTSVVLTQCPQVDAMDVYEAEERALQCAKLNLSRFEDRVRLNYHWHDVAAGIQGPYDFVISNPPFHEGGEEVQALGQAFIEAAAKSLKSNGRFFMVANRHLPYETVLRNRFSQVDLLATQDGFKVFEARK